MSVSSPLLSARRLLQAMILLSGVLLAVVARAQPATFLVGSDSCDFATIQPAINAAAAHPGPDFIRIAMNATYDAQALRITDGNDVEIVGGFETCASVNPTAGARTVINGAGGAADSVLVILGTGFRVLRNLVIRGGDETDSGTGGGIDYEGFGELVLDGVTVLQNRAGFGGGISFHAMPAGGTLSVVGNVLVQNNVAVGSGGGIRLSGNARLLLSGASSAIVGNEAQGLLADSGYGGGLQVLPPARALISSGGLGAGGVIAGNNAKYGGGVAVSARAEGDETGYALLFTADPQRPVRVNNNVASVAGGGLYLSTNADFTASEDTALCAYDFRIDHNLAPDGAAIYLDTDDVLDFELGAAAILNNRDTILTSICGGQVPPNAVRCAPSVPCNQIDANIVEHANGQPTVGSVVSLQTSAFLDAQRVAFVRNTGNDLILVRGNPDDANFRHVTLSDCLIADNTLSARVLATDTADIRNCTISGNALGFSSALLISETARIRESIIWQPGTIALDPNRDELSGNFVITNDPASIPVAGVSSDAPRFVDPARGDYRPRAASPAIDVAPPVEGDDRDLDNLPRDQDLPIVVNSAGGRDLGAYERPALMPLLYNGTFDVDLNHWVAVQQGISSFDNTQNVAGQFPGGSLKVDWVSSGGIDFARIAPRVQCIHLPGPGTYLLDGSARTSGGLPPVSVQIATLLWEFRRNGTEACTTGDPDREGQLNLATGTTFTGPANPLPIVITAAEWTPSSSIAIYTLMKSGGQVPRTAMTGWFDGITLEIAGGLADAIFANGFE